MIHSAHSPSFISENKHLPFSHFFLSLYIAVISHFRFCSLFHFPANRKLYILFHLVCRFVVNFPIQIGSQCTTFRAAVPDVNPFDASVFPADKPCPDIVQLTGFTYRTLPESRFRIRPNIAAVKQYLLRSTGRAFHLNCALILINPKLKRIASTGVADHGFHIQCIIFRI